jgi:hypothetical protein
LLQQEQLHAGLKLIQTENSLDMVFRHVQRATVIFSGAAQLLWLAVATPLWKKQSI